MAFIDCYNFKIYQMKPKKIKLPKRGQRTATNKKTRGKKAKK